MTQNSEGFPPIEPYDYGHLQVSALHSIYYEQCGNPQGKIIVFFHGGPGSGCDQNQRRLYDPAVYRVILFDQRGAGRSTPHACLEENTTWHLVEDIEKLRKHLKVDNWIVSGGSWGSTLALAYAETHPDRVNALILRGVFGVRRKEIHWLYQEGANFMFPEEFERYIAPIPVVERGDLVSAYHRRLTGDNEEEKMRCARAWTRWEKAVSRLIVDPALLGLSEQDQFALAFARIENHYFVHGGFLREDEQLIKDAHRLSGIPGVIIQGRYDVVCPPITAWELHKAWPSSEFVIVPDAGHSYKETGIYSKLIEYAEKFSTLGERK